MAVLSEYKRSVKGILHGESDTGRTTFIEPEETVEISNSIYLLEQEERKETLRILRALTTSLRVHAPLLQMYNSAIGEYDFIRAKALLAIEMNAHYPLVSDKACIHLIDAYHPLLFLYNKNAGKPTIPVSISLNDNLPFLSKKLSAFATFIPDTFPFLSPMNSFVIIFHSRGSFP